MSLFQIKTPCHEDWNSMKIGLHSRHCESYKKDVMETIKKEYSINNYFSVCLFVIFFISIPCQTSSKTKKSNKIKSKETIETKDCRKEYGQKDSEVEIVAKKFVTKDELSQNIKDFVKTLSNKVTINNLNKVTVVFDIPINFNYYDPNAVPNYAEIMPEFDGGYDSLVNFITSNLKYPEWERQNKIEGIVYVGFTINKDGSISDILINVSVAGSKNFDAEVIRVISSMPKWIPGENEGEKVRVRYHLPVRFKL